MKKNYLKAFYLRINIFLLFTLLTFQYGIAQELFVGSGATFYLKSNTKFTTSGSSVAMDPAGTFLVESGNDWGSDQEYVNGEVEVRGSGITKLPVGDNGVYAPVIADHQSQVRASYSNSSPGSGANGVDVNAVADVEYWKLSGTAKVTLPWNQNSEISDLVNNNGGDISALAIVGLDNGIWNLVSAAQTNTVTGDLDYGKVTTDDNVKVDLDNYSEFTFRMDRKAALSSKDLFLTNSIQMLSNPVKKQESSIRFRVEKEIKNFHAVLYDVAGRQIRAYHQISTYNKIGSIEKPNLKAGLYFLKFENAGKQGVKNIIIE